MVFCYGSLNRPRQAIVFVFVFFSIGIISLGCSLRNMTPKIKKKKKKKKYDS